jgi:ribosomal protein S18 acetylase RimI-like enzyme
MYDSLSMESKLFFHPGFLGFKNITSVWLKCQLRLLPSSIKSIRKCLRKTLPHFPLLALVAVNEKNEVIGFAYLTISKQHSTANRLSAELGIGLKDDYQGMRLGSRLMDELIKSGKNEGIVRINLTVMTSNLRAINMYTNHGFKQGRLVQDGEIWKGNRYDYLEMEIDLV